MTPLCTLRRALADPMLLGSALSGDSWQAWRTLLIAAMGEELSDGERLIFKRLTAAPCGTISTGTTARTAPQQRGKCGRAAAGNERRKSGVDGPSGDGDDRSPGRR